MFVLTDVEANKIPAKIPTKASNTTSKNPNKNPISKQTKSHIQVN